MAPNETGDELVFFVNGKKVVEKDVDPETTLLTYLRRKRIQCQKKLQKALNAYSISELFTVLPVT